MRALVGFLLGATVAGCVVQQVACNGSDDEDGKSNKTETKTTVISSDPSPHAAFVPGETSRIKQTEQKFSFPEFESLEIQKSRIRSNNHNRDKTPSEKQQQKRRRKTNTGVMLTEAEIQHFLHMQEKNTNNSAPHDDLVTPGNPEATLTEAEKQDLLHMQEKNANNSAPHDDMVTPGNPEGIRVQDMETALVPRTWIGRKLSNIRGVLRRHPRRAIVGCAFAGGIITCIISAASLGNHGDERIAVQEEFEPDFDCQGHFTFFANQNETRLWIHGIEGYGNSSELCGVLENIAYQCAGNMVGTIESWWTSVFNLTRDYLAVANCTPEIQGASSPTTGEIKQVVAHVNESIGSVFAKWMCRTVSNSWAGCLTERARILDA